MELFVTQISTDKRYWYPQIYRPKGSGPHLLYPSKWNIQVASQNIREEREIRIEEVTHFILELLLLNMEFTIISS